MKIAVTFLSSLLIALTAQAEILGRLNVNALPDLSYRNVEVERIGLGGTVNLFLRKVVPVVVGEEMNPLFQQWAFANSEEIVNQSGIVTAHDFKNGKKKIRKVGMSFDSEIINIKSEFSKSDLRNRYFYVRGLETQIIPRQNDWYGESWWQNGNSTARPDRSKPYCIIDESSSIPVDTEKLFNETGIDIPLTVQSLSSSVSKTVNVLDLTLGLNQDQGYHVTCIRSDLKRFTLGEIEDIFGRQIFFGDSVKPQEIQAKIPVEESISEVIKAKAKFLVPIHVGWEGKSFIQKGKVVDAEHLSTSSGACRVNRASLNPFQWQISQGAMVNSSIAVMHDDMAPGMEMGSKILVNTPDQSFWKRVGGIFSLSSDEFIMSCWSPNSREPLSIQDLRKITSGVIAW